MTSDVFQVGDSVVVKPNTEDPDLKTDLSGWQGKVLEIDKENNLVYIEWDSITIKQMPSKMLNQCEEEGLDWGSMYLYIEDVSLATSRDKPEDVKKAKELLESENRWNYIGEEGVRIQSVLDTAKNDSESAEYEAWKEYLNQKLKCPFIADVTEWQEKGPLRNADSVKVLKIAGVDMRYGVLVTVRYRWRKYSFPLCDLDATDQKSENYQPLRDYSVWFANR